MLYQLLVFSTFYQLYWGPSQSHCFSGKLPPCAAFLLLVGTALGGLERYCWAKHSFLIKYFSGTFPPLSRTCLHLSISAQVQPVLFLRGFCLNEICKSGVLSCIPFSTLTLMCAFGQHIYPLCVSFPHLQIRDFHNYLNNPLSTLRFLNKHYNV